MSRAVETDFVVAGLVFFGTVEVMIQLDIRDPLCQGLLQVTQQTLRGQKRLGILPGKQLIQQRRIDRRLSLCQTLPPAATYAYGQRHKTIHTLGFQ